MAQILCDDKVRLNSLQFLRIQPVKAFACLRGNLDLPIDLSFRQVGRQFAVNNYRFRTGFGWVITFESDPHNRVR